LAANISRALLTLTSVDVRFCTRTGIPKMFF
jgi:hypothetical protein